MAKPSELLKVAEELSDEVHRVTGMRPRSMVLDIPARRLEVVDPRADGDGLRGLILWRALYAACEEVSYLKQVIGTVEREEADAAFARIVSAVEAELA